MKINLIISIIKFKKENSLKNILNKLFRLEKVLDKKII